MVKYKGWKRNSHNDHELRDAQGCFTCHGKTPLPKVGIGTESPKKLKSGIKPQDGLAVQVVSTKEQVGSAARFDSCKDLGSLSSSADSMLLGKTGFSFSD